MKIIPVSTSRIVGVETEYGLQPLDQSAADKIEDYTYLNTYPNYLPATLHINQNGFGVQGRYYTDGYNLEACTPEVTTTQGITASVFAGQKLVQDATKKMFGNSALAIKRTIDDQSQMRGEHENYCVGSKHLFEEFMPLASFLAARVVLTGSGMVRRTYDRTSGHGFAYNVDQRGTKIFYEDSEEDRYVREPQGETFFHKFNGELDSRHRLSYQRLEVVSGSHNMFAYPYAAKLLGTSAVIRLIEQKKYKNKLQIREPGAAIRLFSKDPEVKTKVEMMNGLKLTAPQIVYNTLETALKLPLPEDERKVVELSATIASDLIDGHTSKWRTHVEWLAKLHVLDSQAARDGIDKLTAKSAQTDIKWSLLGEDSISAKLNQKGMIAMMPTDSAVTEASTQPPDNTRAVKRAEFIRAAGGLGSRLYALDWSSWSDAQLHRHSYDPYGNEI